MVDVTQAALELPDPLSKRGPYFGNSFRTEEQQHDQRKNEPVRDTEFAHRPLLSDQRAHCSLDSQRVRASRIRRGSNRANAFQSADGRTSRSSWDNTLD